MITSTPSPISEIPLGENVTIIAKVMKISPLNENEPTRVSQRGKALTGPLDAVNFYVRDDTGEILCKIGRFKYPQLGKKFLEGAHAGKSLYAIKGWVPRDFRMIFVDNVRKLGEHEG